MEQYPLSPFSETGSRLAAKLSPHVCAFVVRAPGRVNLIGEHIDYNGYSVLPMALEQSIHLAVAYKTDQSEKSITLMSTDTTNESVTLPITDMFQFASRNPPNPIKWFHYFQCAFRGVADHMGKIKKSWAPPSLTVLVGGADFGGLWPAAGLSSSSAFVVASALTLLYASKHFIDRSELASICASCERYIGMQAGAMDQVASLLSCKDKAMLIEFRQPPVVYPCPLPNEVVFVVAHTGVHARKAATSKYNERVSECRLASKLLIANSPDPSYQSERPLCLVDAQRAWKADKPELMVNSSDSVVAKYLNSGITTDKQLLEAGSPFIKTGIEPFLTQTTKWMKEFRLRDRAEHVYAEAERVMKFYHLCNSSGGANGHAAVTAVGLAEELGRLMNESHESCAKLYECSCKELDELTAICRSAGALGSRLTGAGWGGCTVSLVPVEKIGHFMQTVRKEYYDAKGIEFSNGLMFISRAGAQAGIMVPKKA